jgi:hypothetical protein
VVGLAVLLVAGVVIARRRDRLTAVLPVAVAAVVMVVAYAVYWSDTGARFFIPGFALASIPAGVAIDAAWRAALRGPSVARVMGIGTCAAVVLAVFGHAHAVRVIGQQDTAAHAADHATGVEMARLAAGRRCRFVSQFGFPAIAIVSGCDGAAARFDTRGALPAAFRAAHAGWVRFAAGTNPPKPTSRIASWQLVPVPGAPTMRLYAAPEVHAGKPVAPAPPG